MAEYIKREAALQFVFEACAECMDACEEFDGINPDCHQCMIEGIKLKLRDMPTADVVPVVRCKDCKHGTRFVCDLAGNEYVECCHGNIAYRLDWFCADGAKMDAQEVDE